MPKKGLNLRDLPQLLSPENAIKMKNYLISAEGGLEKRKGLDLLFDASSATAITMAEEWTSDIILFGYASTKLAAYSISAGTVTDIKTDFGTTVTSGARYGDYFFVASAQDKIGRVSFTLAYDAQSGNFATGLVVTGGTSGATAIILEDADAGATGTLTLGNIEGGPFQNNEAITDSATGAATVNGTLSYTYTEISNAPKAKHIKAIDTRLFAANLETDPTAVQYSEVDDGTNPPFTAWSNTTTATAGGKVFYRNAGSVNVIESIGKSIIVIFADNGKWAFRIDTIDSAGTLTKVDNTLMYLIDAGGNAALQTDEGIFYINKEGLWQLVSIAQENVKYSDQEILTSIPLGNEYFDKITLTDADILKDDKSNTLMITMRNDASTNNFVLTYNTDLKAFGTFTGWNLNKLFSVNNVMYGAGSNTSKVWKILEGNDDDAVDIWYEFEQELSVGQLWTSKKMLGQYIQGELSPSSAPVIKFDIYDRTGAFVSNKLKLQWSYGTASLAAIGYGDSPWGAPFGGDIDPAGTVEQFAGFRGRVNSFQRIKVNISGHDQSPHTVNWLSLNTVEKPNIRRRNLTQL